jgi:hypothetical protein
LQLAQTTGQLNAVSQVCF